MKALDLFCGAGGASMGLSQAGFEVVGVDITPQPRYPFEFHQKDALDASLSGFDFVWASPLCQAHSSLRHLNKNKSYECFISRIREKLSTWGGPYVIENVVGAPLISPVMLCGSSFSLRVRRHRIFESNFPITGIECRHKEQGHPIDVSGSGARRIGPRLDGKGGNSNKSRNIQEAREAMGISWMNHAELSQAIPPAFSKFIAEQFLK